MTMFVSSAIGSALVLLSTGVPGSLQDETGGPGGAVPIVNGESAASCAFPSTVGLWKDGALCTGTLIHPEIVTIAGHCMMGERTAVFGDSLADSDMHELSAECVGNPGYRGNGDNANDYGYCRLERPVWEVPVTPALMGCERDVLVAGADITIAGFGNSSGSGGSGVKRWATTVIDSVSAQVVRLRGGTGLASPCGGDSGGPGFIQLADGTWRVWGMVSAGSQADCMGTAAYSRVDVAVSWIERDSGIDVTPCTDADGTWNPGPLCSGFSTTQSEGTGSWREWCEGTPRSGAASTCGDAFDAALDAAPPTVTLTNPTDGATYESGGFEESITIEATDPDGYGVKTVWLSINGEEQPLRDSAPPFSFDTVRFPEGTFTIVAHAEDLSGNVGSSAAVTIGVGEEPGDPVTTSAGDQGSNDGSGSAESSGTAGDTDTAGSTGGGGGCRASTTAPLGAAWAPLWLMLAAVRRRAGTRARA